MEPKYKRIVLKISGEALAGKEDFWKEGKDAAVEKLAAMDAKQLKGFCSDVFDFETVDNTAKQIIELTKLGVEVGIVIGGGNIWRGRSGGGMDRVLADSMGMLGTVINAICMKDALIRYGAKAEVLSAVAMSPIAEQYTAEKARRLLSEGYVVMFAAGTGLPYFSTDTVAVLRACEINADAYLKATMVDGIYDSDPNKNPNAVHYDTISYDEVLSKNLKVVDAALAALGRDNKKPMVVFKLDNGDSIMRAVCGEGRFTLCE